MAVIGRHPKTEETQALKRIWETVFGDPEDEIDKFFETYFEPQMSAVADSEDGIAATGYLLPVGNLRCDETALPCAMVYAIAALPGHRDHGYATAVVRELLSTARAAGIKATVLHPSEDSLFEFYSDHSPFREWFYIDERTDIGKPPRSSGVMAGLTPAAPEEYRLLRESLLSGVPHIEFDLRALAYQQYLCSKSGGGLYRAETSGGAACAAVEMPPDGSVWIKELLAPPTCEAEVLSAVTSVHPAPFYSFRSPAPCYSFRSPAPRPSRQTAARRFGMLAIDDESSARADAAPLPPSPSSCAPALPYYGLAFD